MINRNEKPSGNRYTIALAGNPNVGKSTVFNCLTGLHQHTGNWAGKTVENARGRYGFEGDEFTLVDLPGTYSLFSHSYEEECAEKFLSFGQCDAAVVVADANCLMRNLNLVLQICEITDNVILAVNLMDEAEKNGVNIDFNALSDELSVPVVPMSASRKKGVKNLQKAIADICKNPLPKRKKDLLRKEVNDEIDIISNGLESYIGENPKNDYYAMRVLCDFDYAKNNGFFENLSDSEAEKIIEIIQNSCNKIYDIFGSREAFSDYLTEALTQKAEQIAEKCVTQTESRHKKRFEILDKFFMGKYTGLFTMVCLLIIILWLTIYGANYPSELLSAWLLRFEDNLANAFTKIGVSDWLVNMLVHGGYRVLAWVVSVMLPPMAIFFPLFTLLEDFGYLPRVAFNLDYYFHKSGTCGKQALTMCMGFGCNAVGVTGARIIDSPRERLIAILTNCFVPCNGRFPTLISIITMFFLAGRGGFSESILSAVFLCAVIVFGIFMTFIVSKILSKTLLKGVPSSFTLELPPYRKPQIGKTIVRSIFDRTLFVLGRAASVALPAGIVIWITANVKIGDTAILTYITDFLNPLGELLGMDGVILTAFILGFPANEIVLPIILMAYMGGGTITEYSSLSALRELLVMNGWTITTAISVMLFSLMHWPCSTTLLTVKKETHSLKWTALSFAIPTLCGMIVCFLFNLITNIV